MAMDNSPDPWYKMKVNDEMERLEAVLNLNKSGSANGTTAEPLEEVLSKALLCEEGRPNRA